MVGARGQPGRAPEQTPEKRRILACSERLSFRHVRRAAATPFNLIIEARRC
jgi:hypothetical protein